MRTPPFQPHPLLPGGQLQTLAGQLLAGQAAPSGYGVEEVPLSDGDKLLLHVDPPEAPDASLPLVILMHGLGGCSESTYVLRITRKLNALGYQVARFNHRGCGRGGAALARQIYHAARVEDVQDTLRYVEARWPGRRFMVAAFSLSANMLLRYVGETDVERTHPGFVKALAVCPPVDLELCSQALAARGNWHIDLYYTRRLVATAHERAQLFAEQLTLFPKKMTLRLFDEVYTAPRAGFKSRDEYYDRASSKHSAHRITIPTVVLAAKDDPIIPPESFTGARFSSAVDFRMEESGGHMGFIGAKPTQWGDRRWMDVAVVDWVRG